MGKRKVKTVGGVSFIGGDLDRRHIPQSCIRDNKVCAFRTKMSGWLHQPLSSACGYCYYTGKSRGEVIDPNGENAHIVYEEVCDRWAEKLPDTALVTNVEEEDYDYECEA